VASKKVIHFPPFRLDVVNQRLLRETEPIPLRPKSFAVLHYLLEHPARLITKDELLDAVWPETAVTDAVLKVSIMELREVLHDDPKQPRYIETAHRSGYRCIAEIKMNNTPRQLTSFVGRERETAEIKRLLAATRLLTLMGPGGSGKTRLAARLSNNLSEEDGDEVSWVELSSLFDSSLVPQSVASALGVREQPERTIVQTLCDYLLPRKITLVIDNCEHLIESCAILSDTLLHACPDLKIVATSRERLGVKGEAVFHVPPLSLPEPHSQTSIKELTQFEGINLFLDRAVTASSNFALTKDNVAVVSELCQRLDGNPLAIELAAARTRVLTVEQIAARLDDCLSFLTTSGRTDAPRHRTLRATIEWSYQLLEEQERTLLRRLATFSGGWTLEAAEEICADDQVAKGEVLDLLSRLVDKSLVVTTEYDRASRYRLLETIRQYLLQEKLSDAEKEQSTKRRHAAYFLRFAEEIAPNLNTAERHKWLTRLDSEVDNLRAALSFIADSGDTAAELRFCDALFFFWFYAGHWSEGRKRLQDALERSVNDGNTASRATAMSADGMLASIMGDRATALSRLEESALIHREHNSSLDLSRATLFLAYEIVATDPVRARSLAEEGVSICRAVGNKFFIALALTHLGAIAFVQKDNGVARDCYEEAVELGRELNDNWVLAASLRGLGNIAFRDGDFELAAAHVKESLVSLRDSRERWLISRSFDTLAEMYSVQGNYHRAARMFGAAAAVREIVGASLFAFYRDSYEDRIVAARSGLGEESFNALWAEGRALTVDQAVAYALNETALDDLDVFDDN